MNVAITPAARREAERNHLDVCRITPTGVTGYVQLSDVRRAAEQAQRGSSVRVTALAREIARKNSVSLADIRVPAGERLTKADVLRLMSGRNAGREIPHSKMRAVIAERMAKSMAEVPQYTMFAEFDATILFENLASYAAEMRDQGDVKPTLSDLLIYLVARALRGNEILNSTFFKDRVVVHPEINVGLAVALEDGLVVPNIKQADGKTLRQITHERAAIVKKAREGKLLPDEYSGGTFTITNLGQYPVLFSTPIINQPESAILGVGTMTEKPCAVEGRIEIRKVIGVSLTCDHRHIDGAAAGRFLSDLNRLLSERITREQMCNISSNS